MLLHCPAELYEDFVRGRDLSNSLRTTLSHSLQSISISSHLHSASAFDLRHTLLLH